MASDIGEGFLRHPEQHGALVIAQGLDPGKGRQVNFDFLSLRQAFTIRMECRDQTEVGSSSKIGDMGR